MVYNFVVVAFVAVEGRRTNITANCFSRFCNTVRHDVVISVGNWRLSSRCPHYSEVFSVIL